MPAALLILAGVALLAGVSLGILALSHSRNPPRRPGPPGQRARFTAGRNRAPASRRCPLPRRKQRGRRPVTRVSELIAIASIASHCTDPKCQKCSARIRWSRRKAWRTSKSRGRKTSERK